MSGIFNRLELDIMQANELKDSISLAFKHNFPAIVVHPMLASDAFQMRGIARGKFKIITPIDWPKGEHFGTIKFRGVPIDAIDADGFEIMLTGDQDANNTFNEAHAITEFIKRHISPEAEVRFVLGTYMRTEENLVAMCNGLLRVRTPAVIRFDTPLKLQVSKANTDEHNRLVSLISSIISAPLKITGNINGIRNVTRCPNAARYGVNLLQARTIIKEFQQPNGLKQLLDTESNDT